MMKMEDAHLCRARQRPRLGDYLVIDTCLNKVGFTTKSGLSWSFSEGERTKASGHWHDLFTAGKRSKVFLEKKKENKKSKS